MIFMGDPWQVLPLITNTCFAGHKNSYGDSRDASLAKVLILN